MKNENIQINTQKTDRNRLKKGLVHYYYGNGNGKTSILLGHIVRALGRNYSVIMFQFLKKHDPQGKAWFYMGEFITLTEKLNIPVIQFGENTFIRSEEQKQNVKEKMKDALAQIESVLNSGEYSLVMLDEVNTAASMGVINVSRLVNMIRNRNPSVEVFLSGREEVKDLKDISDYCIELLDEKHPFNRGIQARPGIEY